MAMASLFSNIPSNMTTLFSAYASISGFAILLRSIFNDIIPKPVKKFIIQKFNTLFYSTFPSDFTFVIEDRWEAVENETFRAVQAYLPTVVGPSTTHLLLGNNNPNNIYAPPKLGIPVNAKVVDFFRNMRFEWILRGVESKQYHIPNKQYFELKCNNKNRQRVVDEYIPHIVRTSESILRNRDKLNLYTFDHSRCQWKSAMFNHPSTFETLAMEPQLKETIIKDLDLFMQRKKYFWSVGRAWKRGYLLYGPPGTGKSSLVAAMANYLRFHIYDLQLQGVKNDDKLRQILTSTTNRSILLIEDIDCSTKSSISRSANVVCNNYSSDDEDYDPDEPDKKKNAVAGVTLSGLLNFIDGLWSSCGDERIIIFTTNKKEKLDPALLRPGRMDVHVHMKHCGPAGFRKLAETYLGVKDHCLFKTIEEMIQRRAVTPAEVAQQLMKCDDPEISLRNLIEFVGTKDEQVEKEEIGVVEEGIVGDLDVEKVGDMGKKCV